jgi:ABC-type uncharacterized transport system involved in gliding motility auxiliary subunit
MAQIRRKELAVAALVAVNLALMAGLSQVLFFRLDASSSRAFSMSKQISSLPSRLAYPLKLTYWVTSNVLDLSAEARDILDALRELEAVSGGMVTVDVVDPVATGREREAEALGAERRQLPKLGASEVSVQVAYAGVSMEYGGEIAALPMALRQDGSSTPGFEYDLYKRVSALVAGRKLKIGIVEGAGTNEFGHGFQNAAVVLQAAYYELTQIAPGDAIPNDLDAVFVFGTGALDRAGTERIEAFARSGKGVFMAVQPYDVAIEDLSLVPIREDAPLEMAAAWGAKIGIWLQLDEPKLGFPSSAGAEETLPYPQWILASKALFAVHPLMNGRETLLFPWASPMDVERKVGLKSTVLAMTGPTSWRMIDIPYSNPADAPSFERERPATMGSYPLALALEGVLPARFSTGEAIPSRAVIVPCVPAFRDYIFEVYGIAMLDYVPGEDPNMDFIRSSADWLVADDSLPIRSRVPKEGRLDRLAGSDREAMVALIYAVALFLVPALVIALALVKLAKRRKTR